MDERKRAIRELAERQGEYLRALDLTLEEIGRKALSSMKSTGAAQEAPSKGDAEDAAEYQRLLRDIAEARDKAGAIRSEIVFLQESRRDERDLATRIGSLRRGLPELDAALGEAVLAELTLPEAALPFRNRQEALARRVEEVEERIQELEHSDPADILTAMGRGLKTALLRSSLSSRLGEIRRLYAETGRALADSDSVHESALPRIREAAEAQGRLRASLKELEAELAQNRAERSGSENRLELLDAGRFPSRAAEIWEGKAKAYEESLRELCRSAGRGIVEGAAAEELPEATRERVRTLQESLGAAERRMEKLEAAVELDLRAEELLRLKRSKAAQERRLEEGKLALESVMRRIAETEERIAELSKN